MSSIWFWIALGCGVAIVGLVYLGRRGRRRSTDDGMPLELRGMAPPRQQHYGFAHIFLRAIVHEEPERMYATLIAADARDSLREMWDFLAEKLEGAEELVAPDRLNVVLHPLCAQSRLAVVHLPEPQAMTEAHFVGVVLDDGRARTDGYYTLELSIDPATSDRFAVLCAWRGELHANYGRSCTADEASFVGAVRELVAESNVPPAAPN